MHSRRSLKVLQPANIAHSTEKYISHSLSILSLYKKSRVYFTRKILNYLSHTMLRSTRAKSENKHDTPIRSSTLSITKIDNREEAEIIICLKEHAF